MPERMSPRSIPTNQTADAEGPGVSADGRLAPVSLSRLQVLIRKGRSNPSAVRTLACRTVAEGRFRHSNHVRDLPPFFIDEPEALLGDDTAPNPSEAALAALGSCLSVGLHANAVARGIIVKRLEIEIEGDLNISSVWGAGDVSDKPVGFTEIRIRVRMSAGCEAEEIESLVSHACKWSPVFNTFAQSVDVIAEAI